MGFVDPARRLVTETLQLVDQCSTTDLEGPVPVRIHLANAIAPL